MIQTQLLKADQPYQIISAAGQVGVQVATLIVTEDKLTADGYQIDTHSHPVVNYAVKDNLTEDLKYWDGDPTEEWKYTQRLQPEGAVWNKVEVRDVRVLGLVGANNPTVDLEKFISLVPNSSPQIFGISHPELSYWDSKTDTKIRNLMWALQRVGIKCSTYTEYVSGCYNRNDFLLINLMMDLDTLRLVKVQIRVADYEFVSPLPIEEIAFRCRIDEDPAEFVKTVISCMRELDQQFIRVGEKIRFVYRQTSETKSKCEELLEQATEQINEAWKNRYSNVF